MYGSPWETIKTENLSNIQTKEDFKTYPEVILASQRISAIEQRRNTKRKPLYLRPERATINKDEIMADQKRKEQMLQLFHKMSVTENSE